MHGSARVCPQFMRACAYCIVCPSDGFSSSLSPSVLADCGGQVIFRGGVEQAVGAQGACARAAAGRGPSYYRCSQLHTSRCKRRARGAGHAVRGQCGQSGVQGRRSRMEPGPRVRRRRRALPVCYALLPFTHPFTAVISLHIGIMPLPWENSRPPEMSL
jgi:hypothetical protein